LKELKLLVYLSEQPLQIQHTKGPEQEFNELLQMCTHLYQ